MRLLPFLSKNERKFLEHSFCFPAKKAIGGDQERSKMTTLLEASLEVFLLFLPFVSVQDLVRVLGAV
jgi:hypothetical protein